MSSAGGARPNPNPSTGGAGTGGRNSAGGAAADTESGGNNSASGGQSAVCPARTPSANQFVVYGEGVAAAWSAYGFSGNFAVQSATVCSGAEALQYVAHQYDGVAFDTPDPNAVPATHLSIRVHVNVASAWAFAAVTVGQTDPHQFIGESTLQPGWQVLELDIPNTTPMTRWLLLEKQDAGNATLTVDDVRLTR